MVSRIRIAQGVSAVETTIGTGLAVYGKEQLANAYQFAASYTAHVGDPGACANTPTAAMLMCAKLLGLSQPNSQGISSAIVAFWNASATNPMPTDAITETINPGSAFSEVSGSTSWMVKVAQTFPGLHDKWATLEWFYAAKSAVGSANDAMIAGAGIAILGAAAFIGMTYHSRKQRYQTENTEMNESASTFSETTDSIRQIKRVASQKISGTLNQLRRVL